MRVTIMKALMVASNAGVSISSINLKERLEMLEKSNELFVFEESSEGEVASNDESVESIVSEFIELGLVNDKVHDLTNDVKIAALNNLRRYIENGGYRSEDMNIIPGCFLVDVEFEKDGKPWQPNTDDIALATTNIRKSGV